MDKSAIHSERSPLTVDTSPPLLPCPRVEAALARWLVTGLKQQGAVPSLIASVDEAASSLLSVRFELSPEESCADQLLHVSSQPVEIIYDAVQRGLGLGRGDAGGRYRGWKSIIITRIIDRIYKALFLEVTQRDFAS